ncbi:MAG: alpha/beta hydrolase [Pseudomonadota bacterium]
MAYNIDPELAPIIDLVPELSIEDPVAAREGFEAMVAAMNAEVDATGVIVENFTVPGPENAPDVPVRLYRPEGATDTTGALLHIHGGGFVIGSLDSEMGSCLALCRELGTPILSVDYRLAPETPFPGGLEDCYASLVWLAENAGSYSIDPARIAVMGMSAGGGLAAATALLAKERGGPALCFQYLGIPELDDRLETPSMQAFVDTPMWNSRAAVYSWDFYLGDAYTRASSEVPVLAAPARAEIDELKGLPPAYVSTMEFDPLRDEGIFYALKLMQAGVATELHSFPGTFHGSAMVPTAEVSQRENTELIAVLRRALSSQ